MKKISRRKFIKCAALTLASYAVPVGVVFDVWTKPTPYLVEPISNYSIGEGEVVVLKGCSPGRTEGFEGFMDAMITAIAKELEIPESLLRGEIENERRNNLF